jgi:hypothetical protein
MKPALFTGVDAATAISFSFRPMAINFAALLISPPDERLLPPILITIRFFCMRFCAILIEATVREPRFAVTAESQKNEIGI